MLEILIKNAQGETLHAARDEENVQTIYHNAYQSGDVIVVAADAAPAYLWLMLEDTMPPALVYMAKPELHYRIPMTEQKLSYNPNSFVGEHHYLSVRKATTNEICARRNVAFNPFDTAENDSAFPHATANIETRGEAVFAARNVIDGNWGNKGHGIYPFESWGIQRREDAFLKVEFGRPVTCDEIGILLRCDFPHDNWWNKVKVKFSDDSEEIFSLQKTSLPQQFLIHPRTAIWAMLCEMKKEEADPSPFPALCEFQLFGW